MDDRLFELVSRFLDGDLDDAEREDLERRLAEDQAFAAELESARRLRRAVTDLADHMTPPAELDTVMEPLLRSAPLPRQRVRPVYRWLGAAAAIILGVTVAVEVARHNPGPRVTEPAVSQRPRQSDDTVFQLAPLPTAQPRDNRPLGATDQLLEEDLPSPPAPSPAALEVVGPLPEAEPPRAKGESSPAPKREGRPDAAVDTTSPGEAGRAREEITRSTTATGSGKDGAATVGDEEVLGIRSTHERARQEGSRVAPQVDGAGTRSADAEPTASLVIEGKVVWSGPSSDCADGRWAVELEVDGGFVVELRIPQTATEEGLSPGCRLQGVLGSPVVGAADGITAAELVVPSPQ